MSNMSYCRFRNTLQDLYDCRDYVSDSNLFYDENEARKLLIKLCFSIAQDFMDEDGNLDKEAIEDLQPEVTK